MNVDDQCSISEAAEAVGVSESTMRRLVQSLGVGVVVAGRTLVPRKRFDTLRTNRKRIGNPRWIESGEEAAAAAIKAVKSRERRKRRAAASGKAGTAGAN
jgi:DNA-binding Lrp family transcriptional regulator